MGRRPLLFGAVAASPDWPGVESKPGVAILLLWARQDAAQYATLLTLLTARSMALSTISEHLGLTATDVAAMLTAGAATAPTWGHLAVAAVSVLSSSPHAHARTWLQGVARASGGHFPAAMRIADILDDSSEDELLTAIGLGAGAAPAGPRVVEGNVDLDGDGTNESFVDRTARQGAVVNCSVLRVHRRPGTGSPEIGFLHAGDSVFVFGMRDGWSAIDVTGLAGFPATARTGYVWQRLLTLS